MEIHQPAEQLDPTEYVASLNGLTGDVVLAAGTNISLVPVGNTITINATDTDTGITQLTGDVTAGPGSGSQAATLATVNTDIGTFNNVTVTGKGLVTAGSNVAYLTGNQTITLSGDVTGSGATAITTNVGAINGVAYNADPLVQYALLAGRATPQQFAFGNAASASTGYLTSTSNATKGKYFLNAAGTMAVDELNTRIGIGTASPTVAFDVLGTDFESSSMRFTRTGTGANDFAAVNLIRQNGADDGDKLGAFQFVRIDSGGVYDIGASIRAIINGTPSDTALPTDLQFFTATASTTLTNTTAPRMVITAAGNIVLGNQAALATNATDGFTYIPTCAGAPTGVPTAYTGKVAMVFDTTNNKLMIYDGGWIGVALA